MFQEVYERMTKDMTASAPSALKIMVVAPPDGNIITFGAKRLHMLARQMSPVFEAGFLCAGSSISGLPIDQERELRWPVLRVV